jgi:hypothetical protein
MGACSFQTNDALPSSESNVTLTSITRMEVLGHVMAHKTQYDVCHIGGVVSMIVACGLAATGQRPS